MVRGCAIHKDNLECIALSLSQSYDHQHLKRFIDFLLTGTKTSHIARCLIFDILYSTQLSKTMCRFSLNRCIDKVNAVVRDKLLVDLWHVDYFIVDLRKKSGY